MNQERETSKQEIIQAVVGGVEVRTLAEEYEIPEPTIYKWLEDSDIIDTIRQQREAAVAAAYSNTDEYPTIHDVCSAFDISIATMYRIVHKLNVPKRRPVDDGAKSSREQIVKLYNAGEKVTDIKALTGRSTQYIYDSLHQAGVELRRITMSTLDIPSITISPKDVT